MVSARLLAAVHLQHILQIGLRANESLLMLMIWELTTQSKLGCALILQACLEPRKDASMLCGIRSGVGWNILSSLVQLFAFLTANLNLKLEETFEGSVVDQLLQQMAIVIGIMLLK